MTEVLTYAEVAIRMRPVLKGIYRDFPGTPENALAVNQGVALLLATLCLGRKEPEDKEGNSEDIRRIDALAKKLIQTAEEFFDGQ